MSKALLPTVKWAQLRDKVYLTIDVQDCKGPKVDLTNDDKGEHGRLVFRGEGAGASHAHEKDAYELDLTLCHAIEADATKVALNDRNVILVVPKKEQGFWPRLLADKHKVSNIQVDWDKWVDEDEEDEVETQDFDISNLQNLSKLGGGAEVSMEGDDSDSDDSDLPGLETA